MRSATFKSSLGPMSALLFVFSFIVLIFISRFVLLHALIGIGIGILAAPTIERMSERYNIPRSLSGVFLFTILLLFFGGLITLLGAILSEQCMVLLEKYPEIAKQASMQINGLTENYPFLRDYTAKFNPSRYFSFTMESALAYIQSGFFALTNFALDILIGVYTGIHAKAYFESLVRSFPQKNRRLASSVLQESAHVMRRWFRGQLLDMLAIGLITGLGLWIVGVPYWAIYGLLTAVLGIIPYVGMMIVVATATIITMTSNPELVPGVIAVFIITQMLEGYVILPLIMKGQSDLPEVPLIIFILLMGAWFGLMGLFVAPAAFAVLRVLYMRLYIPRVDSRLT